MAIAKRTHERNAEKRLDEAQRNGVAWKSGAPTSASGNGARCARTTATAATPGTTSPTTRRGRAPTAGARTVWAASATTTSVLCFALALWNGSDPILKERAFGLANSEGNHGEDVKEYYFYLDSTPTHSYMKYLYKYPQAAYPYDDLVTTNRSRGKHEAEYELLDTGVFDDNRYFDVFVEYAKAAPDDVLIRISVCNRGPDAAPLHVLPTLWFRNTWSRAGGGSKPALDEGRARRPLRWSTRTTRDAPSRASLADYFLYCDADVPLLFTENETNNARLFGSDNASPYVKDGINNFVVHGDATAVNPAQRGTKVAAHYQIDVGAGKTQVIRLRLTTRAPAQSGQPFGDFDAVFAARLSEADAFYASITPAGGSQAIPTVPTSCARRWRECCGPSSTSTTTSTCGSTSMAPEPSCRSSERRRVRNSEWAPHVQRRHHLDAGQVGIPVVRRVGSGVPHDSAGHGRPRLRQAAARPDAAQRLPASERPAARLRVELRRRQSAGACVGDDAALPVRQGAPGRQRRHRVSQVRVFQAAGQFHLVGQPQGSRRRQRLRGRLSRARQHRRIRPFVAAAHGRLPRPGRRHGVDGVLQPADAAHRGRARTA